MIFPEPHQEDIPEIPSEDCSEHQERLDEAMHEKTDQIRIQTLLVDSYFVQDKSLFTHNIPLV